MSDSKIIDITPFIKKHNPNKTVPEKENFKAVLLVEFDKSSCSFQLLFEDGTSKTLPLDKTKVTETIYRLFEVIQVLAEEFDLDI